MLKFISFSLMVISLIGLDFVTFTGLSPVLRVFVKGLSSVLFLTTGFVSAKKNSKNSYSQYTVFVIIGLLFGLFGDVFLGLDFLSKIYFVIGLLAFAAGHVFYIFAFSKKAPKVELVNFIPLIIILPPFLGLSFFTELFTFNGLFPCIVFYAVILSIMVGKTLSFLQYKNQDKTFVWLTVSGAILFAVSDIILLFILFMDKPVEVNRLLSVINLTVYYLGQGFIALSLTHETSVLHA